MIRKLAALVLSVLVLAAPFARAGQYKNFRTAVYIRAYEVEKMKDPAWLETNWDLLEKQLKVDKVYLEVHRDLIIVPDATLAAAKRFFAARGIATAGGIAFVRNERNLFETFCYTQPGQRAKVKEIVAATARNFDEVILDDFFFTSCKCPDCVAAKGDRSWTDYRLALMHDVSQHLVLDVARAINPHIKITIKYPNWYEHFQGMGYDLATQPAMFDQIYTGTETRDSVYNHQHLQPYQGFQQIRYFDNIAPGRNGGGWVDPYDRLVADRYAEQLWLPLFAKAPEITLFAMNALLDPLSPADRAPWQGSGTSFDYAAVEKPIPGVAQPAIARAAGVALEEVDQVLGKLGQPVGIACYKPYNTSCDEDYLHNYLGGLGLPIDLHPDFPTAAPLVLLTESAAADPQIVAKIQTQLLAGKDVVITSGLLRAIQDRGFRRDIADVRVTDHQTLTHEFWGYFIGHQKFSPDILLPELRYTTNDSWELVATMADGLGYPVVHYVPYAGAKLYILTIPDNLADLYVYPAPVLNLIRQIASKNLFVRLEGPSRVALIPYDNHAIVVESFRDEPVDVRLVTAAPFAHLHNEITGEDVTATAEKDEHAFAVHLPPHSYAVFTTQPSDQGK